MLRYVIKIRKTHLAFTEARSWLKVKNLEHKVDIAVTLNERCYYFMFYEEQDFVMFAEFVTKDGYNNSIFQPQ